MTVATGTSLVDGDRRNEGVDVKCTVDNVVVTV